MRRASSRILSCKKVSMNSSDPSGVPRIFNPHSLDVRSPLQTSGPKSAIPGGAGPPAADHALHLPRFASTPQCSRIQDVVMSNARRAFSREVTTYTSSRKASRTSQRGNLRCAVAKPSCCPKAYSKGIKASPCSPPSP